MLISVRVVRQAALAVALAAVGVAACVGDDPATTTTGPDAEAGAANDATSGDGGTTLGQDGSSTGMDGALPGTSFCAMNHPGAPLCADFDEDSVAVPAGFTADTKPTADTLSLVTSTRSAPFALRTKLDAHDAGSYSARITKSVTYGGGALAMHVAFDVLPVARESPYNYGGTRILRLVLGANYTFAFYANGPTEVYGLTGLLPDGGTGFYKVGIGSMTDGVWHHVDIDIAQGTTGPATFDVTLDGVLLPQDNAPRATFPRVTNPNVDVIVGPGTDGADVNNGFPAGACEFHFDNVLVTL